MCPYKMVNFDQGDIVFAQYIFNRFVRPFVVDEYKDTEFDEIYNKYERPERYHHNFNHVVDIIRRINHLTIDGQFNLNNEVDLPALYIATFYHDIIYDIKSSNNEKQSIEYMRKRVVQCASEVVAEDIIFHTFDKDGYNLYTSLFNRCDYGFLIDGSPIDILKTEYDMFKEYQAYSYSKYKEGRGQFIRDDVLIPDSTKDILTDHLNNWVPRIGVYAGSFNPFHIGHLDILRSAENLFDKVIIVFAQNPSKPEREISIPSQIVKTNETVVLPRDKFISDYLKEVAEYADVTLIRGLRDGYDFNYEQKQHMYLKELYPDIKIINIPCSQPYSHISSSDIRGIRNISEAAAKKYIVD